MSRWIIRLQWFDDDSSMKLMARNKAALHEPYWFLIAAVLSGRNHFNFFLMQSIHKSPWTQWDVDVTLFSGALNLP